MKRGIKLLVFGPIAVALVALVVAGCGGNNDDNVKASAQAASAQPATAKGSGADVSVRSGDLGRFLVDGQGRTLYQFEKDTGTMSTCSGACAAAWPPSTTGGKPKAGADVKAALLGTTKRSDGQSQITYNGHPVYRYSGDQAPGDTNGQDLDQFGGSWYVVSPSGKKIEEEESSTTSDDSGGGGSGY